MRVPSISLRSVVGVAIVVGGVIGIAPASAVTTASPADPVEVSVPMPAPNGAAGTDQLVKMVVDGLPRTYRLFVPTKMQPTGAPLVLGLHPLNGTAASYESNSNIDLGAGNVGALVAYPQGFENSWNAGTCCGDARDLKVDDIHFLDAVIDDVESRFSVDQTRVAIGGFPNGSLMSYRYICERSSRIRLAFIGSGAFVGPTCSFSRPVRVLHVHGMKDTIVPWKGTTTSPYTTDGVMPSVSATANVIARADGCSATWVVTVVNSLVNKYVPATCPSGASITIFQSQTLMHGWVTGPDAVPNYGINETSAVWSWLIGSWNST